MSFNSPLTDVTPNDDILDGTGGALSELDANNEAIREVQFFAANDGGTTVGTGTWQTLGTISVWVPGGIGIVTGRVAIVGTVKATGEGQVRLREETSATDGVAVPVTGAETDYEPEVVGDATWKGTIRIVRLQANATSGTVNIRVFPGVHWFAEF